MPLYSYRCDWCKEEEDHFLPLADCDKKMNCNLCGRVMRKLFFPIVTCLPHDKRKWGTSLYRRHDRGEKVVKPKLPKFVPMMKRKGEEDG